MKHFPDLIEPRAPQTAFLDEVLRGLRKPAKELPCKYFYDERGSQLFEQICDLDEYYLTRTELAILHRQVDAIVECLGRHCILIELGSGTSTKTRLLLDHLPAPAAYVPIDISREPLLHSAEALRKRYSRLPVLPVCADFTTTFALPPLTPLPLVERGEGERRVVYFPGSTIGNFGPSDATALLARIAGVCKPDGGLLIGIDCTKDPNLLIPAYNDRTGVTAAFNLNLLARINRELGADFHLECFRHEAVYNSDQGRIEMYLISEEEQIVHVDGLAIPFRRDEPICTEHSYKYDLAEFTSLATPAGFRLQHRWTDDRELFSIVYLTAD
jgi:dimethylhistidine N-methyltransferase